MNRLSFFRLVVLCCLLLPLILGCSSREKGLREAEQAIQDGDVVSLARAYTYARKAGDPLLMARIQQAAGDAYGKSFLYEDALACYENAREEYGRAKDTVGIYNTLYAAARALNNLKRYDQADSIFQFLIRNRKMDPSLEARIFADYALMKVTHEQDYLVGQIYYNHAIQQRPAFYNDNHWGAYAYTLEQAARSDKADQLFQHLEKMGKGSRYTYYFWKGKTMAHRGDFEAATALYEQALDQQADNVRRVLRQSALRAQRDFYEQELQQTRRENRLIRTIILLVFLFLMVLAYGVFAALRRRQEQARAEEEALLETARTLSEEVGSLQEERARLQTLYARSQQRHFKEMGALLKTTLGENETNAGAKQATLYAKAKQAMKAIQSDPGSDRIFESQLNDCFDQVMEHLRSELPNHTDEYYRFASFVFAGFDNETLMALTGTRSLDSVYAKKKRLRQDIQASRAPHKEQFQRLL